MCTLRCVTLITCSLPAILTPMDQSSYKEFPNLSWQEVTDVDCSCSVYMTMNYIYTWSRQGQNFPVIRTACFTDLASWIDRINDFSAVVTAVNVTWCPGVLQEFKAVVIVLKSRKFTIPLSRPTYAILILLKLILFMGNVYSYRGQMLFIPYFTGRWPISKLLYFLSQLDEKKV